MRAPPLIWVLIDDRAGNVAQALGVAEALQREYGRDFKTQAIRYNPLARLPSALMGASLIGLAPETRMTFGPPWPDVVIAAGRRTAPIARWIKKNAGKPVVAVQIMSPGRRGAEDFDLIAVPRHDVEQPGGDPPNVLRITGAPHRLTNARLASAADTWAGRIVGLPRPYIALIVGGATHRKPFPAHLARDLGEHAARLAAAQGGSILFASSRRTGSVAEKALEATLTVPHKSFLWSKGGDNPYFGFLALADAIIVTGDSVSMCSEACATPAPVYIYAPEGMVAPKHARLHRHLFDAGFAQPLSDRLGAGPHPPLNAANDIARRIDDLVRRSFG
ncbi:MAG: mitochondrial fission ELM1 family protein [Rhodospirillaceae bacterium]